MILHSSVSIRRLSRSLACMLWMELRSRHLSSRSVSCSRSSSRTLWWAHRRVDFSWAVLVCSIDWVHNSSSCCLGLALNLSGLSNYWGSLLLLSCRVIGHHWGFGSRSDNRGSSRLLKYGTEQRILLWCRRSLTRSACIGHLNLSYSGSRLLLRRFVSASSRSWLLLIKGVLIARSRHLRTGSLLILLLSDICMVM